MVEDEYSTQLHNTKGLVWMETHSYSFWYFFPGFQPLVPERKKSSLPFPFAFQQRRVRMDLTEVKIEQAPYHANHFARIPEDLILCILSKMDNLKYLCQCRVVSKHFNSIINLVKTVSIALPSTETSSAVSAFEMDDLFGRISDSTVEEISEFILSAPSLKWLNFMFSLEKFCQLKSIVLNFTCPVNHSSSSLFKIKVKFGDSGVLIKRVISIVPARLHKMTEQGQPRNNFEPLDRVTYCWARMTFGCCVEWVLVLCLLLKFQPSLESVGIKNSNKPWTLLLREIHLAAWRKSMDLGGDILCNITPMEAEAGVLSELRLPVSGYIMKNVKYLIGDVKVHSGSGTEDATGGNESPVSVGDDAMTWECVRDKRIIDEAVHETFNIYDSDEE